MQSNETHGLWRELRYTVATRNLSLLLVWWQMERKCERLKPYDCDIPSPVYNSATPCIRASKLQYYTSPSLTFHSWLCILIFSSTSFPSTSFWFYASLFHIFALTWTVSLSEPLALSRQTSHPSALTGRGRGGKRKRKMRERKDCASVSSLSPSFWQNGNYFHFELKILCRCSVNEKT